MIRHAVFFAALLAASVATAEPKVSGGGTPPAGSNAQSESDKKPAPPPGRSDEARKALGALKGGSAQGKRGAAEPERKPGGR